MALGFCDGDLTHLGLIGVRAQCTGLLLDDDDGEVARGVSCKGWRLRLLLDERLERADRLRLPSTIRAGVALGVKRTSVADESDGLEPLLVGKFKLGPSFFHPHGQVPSGTLSSTLSYVM